jgi:hypothetical protein
MRQFRILTVATLIALALGTFQSAAPAGAMNRLTITTTPTYLYFGNIIVGTTSPTQTVTIRNTGSTDVTLGTLTVTTSTGTVEYILRARDCNGKILTPTQSCSFTVAFRPTSAAYKTGTVNIPNSETATPITISLTGYGITGTNLLQAPNFELPLPKPPLPWRSDPPFIPLNDALDCSVSFSLYCSVRLTGSHYVYLQSITQAVGRIGIPGDRYLFRLSSKARNVPAGGEYKVEVQLWNMYNKVVGTKVINFAPGTHEFKTVTGIITAKAQYSWVIFRFTYKNPSGTAWFDSAQLIYLP